jgi:hypothetical protein
MSTVTEWVVSNEHLLVAFSTMVMGAFTVVLAIATAFLYLATRALVRGGEQTAERQLRAYVFVTGKGLVEQTGREDRFVHQFEVRNTGLTPAYRLQIESLTRPLPHPLPAGFDFSIIPAGRNPTVMMLGSGLPVRHDSFADEPLSQAEMELIKTPNSGCRLYTFGTVKYDDCFRRPRFTNFCYFLEWESRPNGYYAFNVHPSEQHNDAS